MSNLFLCLCALLMVTPDHQERFAQCEGFDLMFKCLKEQKSAAVCVPKVINYAITKSAVNCHRFIKCGGLRYVFPILMGKTSGLPRPINHHSKSHSSSSNKPIKNYIKLTDIKDAEEMCIGIISQLCIHIPLVNNSNLQLSHNSEMSETDTKDSYQRLLVKFLENDYEKLDRCGALFSMYWCRLETTEQDIQQTIQLLSKSLLTDQEEERREEKLQQLQEYTSQDNIRRMVSK